MMAISDKSRTASIRLIKCFKSKEFFFSKNVELRYTARYTLKISCCKKSGIIKS